MFEKIIKVDSIEIIGDYKIIQYRIATIVLEDNKQISKTFHRNTIAPDHDLQDIPKEVKDIAMFVWTDDIKSLYKLHLEDVNNSKV
jgi:hypothetical protein